MVRPIIGEMITTMHEIVASTNSTRKDDLIDQLEELFNRCCSCPEEYMELDSFYQNWQNYPFHETFIITSIEPRFNETHFGKMTQFNSSQLERLNRLFNDTILPSQR